VADLEVSAAECFVEVERGLHEVGMFGLAAEGFEQRIVDQAGVAIEIVVYCPF
jgi:hypothetical protein